MTGLGVLRRLPRGGPLSVRGFPFLLIGQFTSSVGDLCYAIALPWLILSGSGGPVLLGATLAGYGAARIVGIPAGGVLADRFGARRLMLLMDVGRCVLVTALGAVTLLGSPPAALLVVVAVLVGVGAGLFSPASYALLPDLLGDDDLGAGNSLSSIANQAGSVLGPVLGGALVSGSGPGPALLVDGFTFAVSAVSLFGVRHASAAAAPQDSAAPTDLTTFRDVVRHGRLLHVMLLMAVIGNLVYAGASEVALPTLAHARFGAGGYSAILVGIAVGMIAGAVLVRRFGRVSRPAPVIGLLGLAMAGAIASVPFAGGLVGAVACVTVFAVANSWSGIMLTTSLQVWAPRHLLARVMSVLMLAANGTFPVSVAVAGITVNWFGVAGFFPVSGGAMALGIAAALSSGEFRRYRTGDRFRRRETSQEL